MPICIMLFVEFARMRWIFPCIKYIMHKVATVRTLAKPTCSFSFKYDWAKKTDDGSHQHDAGPVHLRVDSSSLPSQCCYQPRGSQSYLKKEPWHPRVMPKRHLAVVVAGLNQTLPAGKLDVWTTDANKPMNTKEAMIPGVYSFAAEIPPTARIAGGVCNLQSQSLARAD